ncbi:MAG TPA: HD domain-containing phosphohydrolase [Treponemataceae bacterium]|nr:HD domain-containing phosphohydrolase [Treponemataceae bacterium]
MNKKRFFLVVPLVFLLSFTLSADAAMGQRFLNAAKEQYSIGNLDKAYTYINNSMKMYVEEPVSNDVIFSAQLIYFEYLQKIKEESDIDAFVEVKNTLKEFPLVINSDITALIETLNMIEIKNVESSAEEFTIEGQQQFFEAQLEAMKIQQDYELKMLQKSQQAAAENQQSLLEQMNEQTGKFADVLTKSTKATEESSKTIKKAIIGIGIVLVVVFLLVILFVIFSWQNSKKQQERFQATLEMVAQMNRKPNERLALGAVTDLYDNDLRSAGSSRWGVDALPEPELSEKDIAEINELAVECERLGAEIDFATGRKNNSKNVSELVYKLSCSMGINPAKAKIYFCAGMVYDVGFLSINTELLHASELTEDQKYEIRSHVLQGVDRLDFVPEKYKDIFIDAAIKHHENLDGTGYPEGLEGDDVPTIARLIRVVEMFTSLISRRKYRGIMDKESAINELRAENGAVDQALVDLLDSII